MTSTSFSHIKWVMLTTLALTAAGTALVQGAPQSAQSKPAPAATADHQAVLTKYCIGCHSERMKSGDLVLQNKDVSQAASDSETWERVVRKLKAKAMPPLGSPRPDAATLDGLVAAVERTLDQAAAKAPNPGRPPVHRLNRVEYTNAIRDLLGLEIDGVTMLPADDTGFGFDNIADVLTVSPALFERYMLAATKISRLAVEDPTMRAKLTTYDLPYLSLGQDERMSDLLPFGSRGGTAVRHYFPLDGEYEVRFTLQRSDLAAGYGVRGLGVATQIDVRLDKKRIKLFSLGGKKRSEYSTGPDAEYPDEGLAVRFNTTAGNHVVGLSLNQDRWLAEGVTVNRLPLTNNGYSLGRESGAQYGRIDAGIEKVDINGPFNAKAPVGSDVQRKIFPCQPATAAEDEPCATKILTRLARLAYRRPVSKADIGLLLDFYRQGKKRDGTFRDGIKSAIGRMIVDPNFLFRIERDPAGVKPGASHELTDLELASRMSFFLWSSIPDDELLTLAERGRLKDPSVIEQQVRRMVRDEKSDVFIESFFGQWLTIKNVATARPDPKAFPEFDENLRRAFLEETRLFLESQIREDRPAHELLTADYTFANERLAQHYGIPGVVGNHFRRVTYPDSRRAGLLGHGSVLMVTLYNDRTSVVVRGKFIMDTVFGTPPPAPPANVPPLANTKIEGTLRQRMELHRKNPVCASCHRTIDPLGFALENFNGVGRYRSADGGATIDPSGELPDGSKFDGPATFRKTLLARQDAFLSVLTKNLLTYAMGRGVEMSDMPAVRKVLGEAKARDYRWSALVTAIVRSVPFQMRRAQS